MPDIGKVAVKARDLRANIQAHGFETGMVMTLELLLEEFSEHKQVVRQCVGMISEVTDKLGEMMCIGVAMKESIEEVRRLHKQAMDE